MAEVGEVSQPNISDSKSFDDFWVLCPHKSDKKRSHALWNKLSQGNKKLCYQGMSVYKKKCGMDGRTNILMPSTFIYNERWDDLGVDVKNPAYEQTNKLIHKQQPQEPPVEKKPQPPKEPTLSHADSLKYINEIKSKLSNFGSTD